MSVWSKLAYYTGQPILTTNCYETIHTWEPDCNKAILVALPHGIFYAFKTYASFYLIATLVARRGNIKKVDWKRFCKDVIVSTIFLTCNLSLYIWFLCKIRHMVGFFTPMSMGFISSILASFVSILIEKPSRRPALALYLTNLASETVYRHLAIHGKVPMFNRGECVPFIAGLSIFSYLYSKGRLSKEYHNFLDFAFKVAPDCDVINKEKLPDDFHAFVDHLRKKYSRTEKCHHRYSCVSHSVEGFAKNFSFGLIGSSILTLWMNKKYMFSNPLRVITSLLRLKNLKLPTFLGLMPLLYNATRCSLNRVPGVPKTVGDVLAAGMGGLSMVFYPTVSIAMYCLWKSLETLYFDLVDRGYLPKVKHGEVILYAISTGYVLWQVIVEPRALRKGYLNFLAGLTDQRLTMFNRRLYDHFGYFNRDLLDCNPVLDHRFTTLNSMLYQPLVK